MAFLSSEHTHDQPSVTQHIRNQFTIFGLSFILAILLATGVLSPFAAMHHAHAAAAIDCPGDMKQFVSLDAVLQKDLGQTAEPGGGSDYSIWSQFIIALAANFNSSDATALPAVNSAALAGLQGCPANQSESTTVENDYKTLHNDAITLLPVAQEAASEFDLCTEAGLEAQSLKKALVPNNGSSLRVGMTSMGQNSRTTNLSFYEAQNHAQSMQPSVNFPHASILTPLLPVILQLSRAQFPESVGHIEQAVAAGYPNTLTLDSAIGVPTAGRNPAIVAADKEASTTVCNARRSQSMQGHPVRAGLDRDEYPFAMTLEGGRYQGRAAHVAYINPADNQGSGRALLSQIKAKGLLNGTRFTINIVP